MCSCISSLLFLTPIQLNNLATSFLSTFKTSANLGMPYSLSAFFPVVPF